MTRDRASRNRRITRAWAHWLVRHARAVLVSALVLCGLLVPLAITATQHTVPDGWLPETTTSVQVQELTAQEFGRSETTYYLLFSDPLENRQANDPSFVEQVQYTVRPLRSMEGIESVLAWGTTRNELLNTILISDDASMSLAVVNLSDPPDSGFGTPDWLRANLASSDLNVQITGLPVVGEDFRVIGHKDLVRAELIALPVTLILLVVIFRGILPALMPVSLAVGSMMVTLAAIAILGRYATVSVFTVNTVTMLGMAVGINYALIMVNRFREEIKQQSLEGALINTLATAGKTVITSGSTVAIGLSGLLFFAVPAATTTALLGALVVLTAVVLALTALPAGLVVFASRIGRERATNPFPQILPRIERVRERYPGRTLISCLAVLAIMTSPVLGIKLTSPGISNLPSGAHSRATTELIQHHFPAASTSPIEIVVQPTRGTMMDANNLQRYQELSAQVTQFTGVERAESLWTFIPSGFSSRTLASSFVLEPDLIRASKPFLTPSAARITVIPDPSLTDSERQWLVRELRAELDAKSVRGLNAMVGGAIALDLDVQNHLKERTPTVLVWVLILTAMTLFAHFRSVVLPIKAIVLNLASMGASFGVLVWIFQDGHLVRFFGAESTGSTVMLVPILMFCFLFGLGMDFEIIMLSRIREAWQLHGNTTVAVRDGLNAAAGIVSASALLMLTVFLAFAFSELDIVKAIGIGLAIAVAIDATIVRLLMLPAAMQLMGRWNWWPSSIKHKAGGEPD